MLVVKNFVYARCSRGKQVFELQVRDFRLNQSEIVFLNGPSGCGKTTLLNLVSGVENSALDEQRRQYFPVVSYVMHESSLLPWRSVAENVKVEGRMRGIMTPMDEFDEFCYRFKLPEDIGKRKPSELSLGMRQRVEVARALAFKPHLLLLDEGLSGIDVASKRFVFEALWEAVDHEGMTLLGTAHQVGDLLRLAQRIYLIEAGRIDASVVISDDVKRRMGMSVAELLQIGAAAEILMD